jgi:hypothetical protein
MVYYIYIILPYVHCAEMEFNINYASRRIYKNRPAEIQSEDLFFSEENSNVSH